MIWHISELNQILLIRGMIYFIFHESFLLQASSMTNSSPLLSQVNSLTAASSGGSTVTLSTPFSFSLTTPGQSYTVGTPIQVFLNRKFLKNQLGNWPLLACLNKFLLLTDDEPNSTRQPANDRGHYHNTSWGPGQGYNLTY